MGDVLALSVSDRIVLFCVVEVHPHRSIDTIVVEELDFNGTTVPSPEQLLQLQPRTKDLIPGLLANGRRFQASDYDRVGWEKAGFEKIGTMTVSTLPDTYRLGFGTSSYSWQNLAACCRTRAAE